MRWLWSAVPIFHPVVQQLLDLLEFSYMKTGKQTKRAVSRISVVDAG